MENILIFTIVVTIVFLMMAAFVVSYILLFQKKKIQSQNEKAALQARFEQETLNARNEVQEATMRQIARELHDNIGQMLSLVKIQLNALQEDVPQAEERINDSRTYLNQAMTDIRGLSKTLNSENILHAGLAAGIRFELERLQKTGFLHTSFADETAGEAPDDKTAIIVFRMFQEIIHNVVKHAKAKNLTVSLFPAPKGIILEVLDDGIGFDSTEAELKKGFGSGSGLANLHNRAALINGILHIQSAVGKGTTIQLTIPTNTPHANRSSD